MPDKVPQSRIQITPCHTGKGKQCEISSVSITFASSEEMISRKERENFIAGDNLGMACMTVIWIWQPEFPGWFFFDYSCSKISVLILERHPLCLTYKVKEIFIYILHMWSYIYTHTHFQISGDLKWLINHCSTPGTGILSPI